MSVEHMHVICGKSQYFHVLFVCEQQQHQQLLNGPVPFGEKRSENFRYWNWKNCIRCDKAEYGLPSSKSCIVEVNLWWEDNVLWKGKTWKTESKDPNPMSNFVNNGTADDKRTNRNGTTRKQSKEKRDGEKSQIKWMRHSQDISSEYIHLSEVRGRLARAHTF